MNLSPLDLSVVIPTYNTKKLTMDCLESLFNLNELKMEIIIIDNGSTDGSFELLKSLKKKHPLLKVVRNKKNTGFGAANNQGMALSRGKYILLLNSDTVVIKGTIGKVFSLMEDRLKAGIASCALLNSDLTPQGTGGAFPTLLRVFLWMYFLEDIPFVDRLVSPFHPIHGKSFFYKGDFGGNMPQKKDWVTGAFMMIKRSAAAEVGYFDTDYFMYTEEVDYCYRFRKKGYETWFFPEVAVVHHGGGSSNSEFPILSEFSGVKTFYRKHMPSWQYPVLRFIMKSGCFLRVLLFGVLGQPHLSKIYGKAIKTI